MGNVTTSEGGSAVSELGGIDADHNGIRDDVDAWIESQRSFTPKQKIAVQNYARALQSAMVTQYKDREDARKNTTERNKLSDCMDDLFYYSNKDPSDGYLIIKKVMRITENTRARILKQNANDALLSGMAFEVSIMGTVCKP